MYGESSDEGVTRSQKYRAIGQYFTESEKFEVRWPEARGVFNVHRERIRGFLNNPGYGSREMDAMTTEEKDARYMLAYEGLGRERIMEEEDADSLADDVSSSRAGVNPGGEGDSLVMDYEAGRGGRRRWPRMSQVRTIFRGGGPRIDNQYN